MDILSDKKDTRISVRDISHLMADKEPKQPNQPDMVNRRRATPTGFVCADESWRLVEKGRAYHKAIHLLYVPTMFCNLDCSYCYLGEQTSTANLKKDSKTAISTLHHALNQLEAEGILAFNVSLHGGEVTTLSADILESLFYTIEQYYLSHFDAMTARGFRKTEPHIKTNLYKFANLYELLDKYKVSISASIDLPLRLHDEHRLLKSGASWRKRTENNLKLLANYPHKKKISATLSQEHLSHTQEIIDDIWYIHHELGFDMNNFNLMFAFESALNDSCQTKVSLTPATQEQHNELYRALYDEFVGTELEVGLRRHWFDEFSPSYCTNAINCGEKFYLLQGDGDVYSCVRGQGVPEFHYGNIFDDTMSTIITNGASKINHIHQSMGFDSDCEGCHHLSLCHTGCAVVKFQQNSAKSYTCDLQKNWYKDNPLTFEALTPEKQPHYAKYYQNLVHPYKRFQFEAEAIQRENKQQNHANLFQLPNDIADSKNALSSIIADDANLRQLYREDAFILQINDEYIPLSSQILKSQRRFYTILESDKLIIHVADSLFSANCQERLRNTLYLQMLTDRQVVYGDEQRTKQAHLFTHQLWLDYLEPSHVTDSQLDVLYQAEQSTNQLDNPTKVSKDTYLMADITDLIALYKSHYQSNERLNLFFTTHYLREYHYQKHKQNAFYHIQAINLPFQNLEFYYGVLKR